MDSIGTSNNFALREEGQDLVRSGRPGKTPGLDDLDVLTDLVTHRDTYQDLTLLARLELGRVSAAL